MGSGEIKSPPWGTANLSKAANLATPNEFNQKQIGGLEAKTSLLVP